MKLRRITASFLSVAMVTALLTACGDNKATDTQAAQTSSTATQISTSATKEDPFKEKMEISVATWDIDKAVAGGENDEVLQTIYKKFNITIKPVNITWSDYTDKINLWASSGQLPDLFSADKTGSPIYRQWATQGVIHALPDDLSNYADLDKIISSPDVQALKVDGKIYCIPRSSYSKPGDWQLDRAVLYRWDWAQKLGITKEPETWDEFATLLKAYTSGDPESKGKPIGLTVITPLYLEALMLSWNPGVVDSGGANNWMKEDGKWIPAFFSKTTLPGIKAIKALYSDGLIDKDFALIKGEEGTDKFASGRAGAIVYSSALTHLNGFIANKWSKTYPDKNFTECVKVLKIPAAPDGNRYHFTIPTYWSEAYINGNADDKKVERILSLANYLFSDEGRNLIKYGIEGKDFNVDASGKITVVNPGANMTEKYPSLNSIPYLFHWSQFVESELTSPTYTDELRAAVKQEYDWYNANTKDTPIDFTVNSISTPAKDKLVINHKDDMAKLIISKGDVEKEYKEIVDGYNAKGLATAIDEVTAAAAKIGK